MRLKSQPKHPLLPRETLGDDNSDGGARPWEGSGDRAHWAPILRPSEHGTAIWRPFFRGVFLGRRFCAHFFPGGTASHPVSSGKSTSIFSICSCKWAPPPLVPLLSGKPKPMVFSILQRNMAKKWAQRRPPQATEPLRPFFLHWTPHGRPVSSSDLRSQEPGDCDRRWICSGSLRHHSPNTFKPLLHSSFRVSCA